MYIFFTQGVEMHLQHLYFLHVFMPFCINLFLSIEMSKSEKVVAFVTKATFEPFICTENPILFS